MHLDKEDDSILTLSTGKKVYCYNAVFGLRAFDDGDEDMSICYGSDGSDGSIGVGPGKFDEVDHLEAAEIATHMISRWVAFRARMLLVSKGE